VTKESPSAALLFTRQVRIPAEEWVRPSMSTSSDRYRREECREARGEAYGFIRRSAHLAKSPLGRNIPCGALVDVVV